MKLKSHLIMLYSIRENEEGQQEPRVWRRRVELCKELLSYLMAVDPGRTKKLAVFMMEMNQPRLKLAKWQLEREEISRIGK